MDRHLKERLVGGLVVIAVAIIFIPELLSGPKHEMASVAAPAVSAAPEGAVRTYTIDLAHEPAAAAAESNSKSDTSTAAPPQEISSSVDPHAEATGTPPITPSEEPASTPPKEEVAPASHPQATRTQSPAPNDEPATQAMPNKKQLVGSGWAVQVGSVATQSGADRIAEQFTRKGYSAYTEPVRIGPKTLYRIRLGPKSDRGEAEALLKKVKTDQPSAILVTQP